MFASPPRGKVQTGDVIEKLRGCGRPAAVAQSADLDIVTYQLTQAGLALEATVDGMRFWKDRDLN